MAAHRWWWERWWCAALAILVNTAPCLWRVGDGSAHAATAVIAAGAMLWLSRMLQGRVQPSAYGALPFAVPFAFGPALAMAGFALWIWLARWLRLRAGVFVLVGVAVCVVRPVGWLALVTMALAAEVARARAVETDGVRRGWAASIGRAACHVLPLAPAAAVLLVVPPEHASLGGDWMASLARKPGWVFGALGDRWPVLDIGSLVLVALAIDRSYRDRRFRHAPMLVAAALGMAALFVILPQDAGLAGCAMALALLSIRCTAWMKQRHRSAVACVAIAFLLLRAAAGSSGGGSVHDGAFALPPAPAPR